MHPLSGRRIAARAKQVTVASVAVAAAGAMYGVSHDGRGATAADEPVPGAADAVTETSAISAVPSSSLGGTTAMLTPASSTTVAAVATTAEAAAIVPDQQPTPPRLRTRRSS